MLIGLEGLSDIFPAAKEKLKKLGAETLSIQEAIQLIQEIGNEENLDITADPETIWRTFKLQDLNMTRKILRGEMAILIDQMLDPFNQKQVNITGEFIQ